MTHLISRAPMSGDFHWREILSYLLFLLVEFFEWRERYRVLHEHLPPPLPFPQHVVVVSMPTFDDMFIAKKILFSPLVPPPNQLQIQTSDWSVMVSTEGGVCEPWHLDTNPTTW